MPTRVLKADRLIHNAWVIMAVGFGLILAAVLAVAILVARSEEADRWVAHTFDVQSSFQSLLSELGAAESAQRNYLLTENQSYLSTLDNALTRIPTLVGSLHQSTSDNASQQARLERVEPLITARIALKGRAHQARRAGQGNRAGQLGRRQRLDG